MTVVKISPSQMKWFIDSFDRIEYLIKENKVHKTDVFWRELSIDDVTIDHFICTVDDISQFIGSDWANNFVDKHVYMRKNGCVYKIDLTEKEPRVKPDVESEEISDYSRGFMDGVRAVDKSL